MIGYSRRQEGYGRSTGNINHVPHSGIKPLPLASKP